jgi:putative ABC transport system permease protein
MYSVIAYLVAQRSHEFGIRMAIGATGGSILRLVMSQGLRVVLAGSAAAAAIALLGADRIEPRLFDESGHDPVIYVGVIVTMVVVAAAASVAPALRAAALDPAATLREE